MIVTLVLLLAMLLGASWFDVRVSLCLCVPVACYFPAGGHRFDLPTATRVDSVSSYKSGGDSSCLVDRPFLALASPKTTNQTMHFFSGSFDTTHHHCRCSPGSPGNSVLTL